MKRMATILVLLLTTASLFAGEGKSCDMKKTASKAVELTGTLARVGDGDDAHTVFRVTNGGQSFHVCEQSQKAVDKVGMDGTTSLHVKGKLITCEGSEKLVIEKINKM